MNSYSLHQKIKDRIWEKIKDYFYEHRIEDAAIVQNLNYSHKPGQKKALVCYLTYSLFFNWERKPTNRTQPSEILAILKALTDMGYAVDVVGCNDLKALQQIEGKHYDLLFGFGETFHSVAKQQPWAVTILYMTEHHPSFSFTEEQKRIDYYNQRKKTRITSSRSGMFYKPHHFENTYDHLIVMGEKEPFQEQYRQVYDIYPTGLINPDFNLRLDKHEASRTEFLWLGSPNAAIHKGLDLLLDIFAERDDLTLHIAGLSEKDRRTLAIPKRKNILDCGFVNIRSAQFLELANRCSFMLLPSCSEGFATSVTTGMLHGLIPVVMRHTGFNRISQHAFLLDDYTLAYLDGQLTTLSQLSAEELTARSQEVYAFAHDNFTNQAFEKNIAAIFNVICSTHDKSNTSANAPALIG